MTPLFAFTLAIFIVAFLGGGAWVLEKVDPENHWADWVFRR